MSLETHSKAPRRSTSHSTAMSQDHSPVGANWSTHNPSGVLSTRWSTRGSSPSGIPSLKGLTHKPSGIPNRDYLQGSSHTTGGIFRGQALGSAFNFADADQMDIDPVNYTKTGKVLLYTSRDQGAYPAMTITHVLWIRRIFVGTIF